MTAIMRELGRNAEAVFAVDRELRLRRAFDALAQRPVRERMLVALLTTTETYAGELVGEVGASRTAVVNALSQLELEGLIVTRIEREPPEQLKRPRQRRVRLTKSGRTRGENIRSEVEDQQSPFDELWHEMRKRAIMAQKSKNRPRLSSVLDQRRKP